MRLPTATLILAIFISLSHCTCAQEQQVVLNLSTLAPINPFPAVSPYAEDISQLPTFQLNLGVTSRIYHSMMNGEVMISYIHSKVSYNQSQFSIMPSPGSVVNYSFTETLNLLGFKAGLGPSWHLAKTSQISVPTGAGLHYGLTEKNEISSTSSIFFGFYSRPTYSFAAQKANNHWLLSIFAEINGLWESGESPGDITLLIGGGLGLSYTLR